MAYSVSDIMEFHYTLSLYKISDLLIIIGQLTVGGRRIVIENNHQLVRIKNLAPTHFTKGTLNTGRVIMTKDKIGFFKNDISCRGTQNFFHKSSCSHTIYFISDQNISFLINFLLNVRKF